jgi:microcystin-dependent protein
MNIHHSFPQTRQLILCLLMLTLSTQIKAQTQGVGIDVPSPHASAILDLDDAANERGLLVPRMSSTERAGIVSPADGLLVYDSDQKMFYHYDGGISQWQAVNPFSYRKGASAVDEDNFVITFVNNKSFVIGNVATPSARLEVEGDVKASGNLTVAGTGGVTSTGNVATSGQFIGNGTVPLGGIIMWSGTVPPAGWTLCNGQTSASGYRTPDLRGRFIVGYNSTPGDYSQPGNLSVTTAPAYTNGNTGGAASVALTTAQLPAHNHSVTDPGHTHSADDVYPNNVGESTTSGGLSWNIYREGTGTTARTSSSSTTGISIGNTGSGVAHENRPPYYVLAFIMRTN